jgi:hypothetical protein|tara:strand:+ start:506 stop:700 length:195 start_codon:yes stop_codon:yes gene_type:complete
VKKKNYSQIINKIQLLRKKNNINWMDILRLAMKYAPNETKKILKNINNYDKKISNEVSSITKLK